MEALLQLATKAADEAEVFALSHEETPVAFESNRLKHLQTKQIRGIAIRIIRNGRIGFSATTRPGYDQELVDTAVEMSQFGAEAKFHFPPPSSYTKVNVYDPAVESVSLEAMVDLGRDMIAKVRDHTPDILCEAGITKSVTTISIINSRGGQASYTKTSFSLGVEGTLIRDTDMLFVGEGETSCHPLLDSGFVVNETLRQLDWAKEIAIISTCECPVILTPHGVANTIVAPLAAAINGKIVLQGASPLGNRRGEHVFDPIVSVWDDATINYRPVSRICDDEGMPTRRTPLIENGRVANFIYDLQTAGLANTESTGNGYRGLGSLPNPSTSAIVFGTGDMDYEAMIKDIREGLIVEQLLGAGQGNILGGEFSGNILLGYKIENGEIVGRVKNTMIAGNIYEVLSSGNVAAAGREARWVGSSLLTPPIYLRSLGVASKG